MLMRSAADLAAPAETRRALPAHRITVTAPALSRPLDPASITGSSARGGLCRCFSAVRGGGAPGIRQRAHLSREAERETPVRPRGPSQATQVGQHPPHGEDAARMERLLRHRRSTYHSPVASRRGRACGNPPDERGKT
ncbi:hypothetical protein NDU88_008002 [Pleurodeles waltl]|uniref:Uncharacterized protein n=1 Tax=Pleurodeles waltl TaxID=8319 RepID=A0AAV7NUX3_PLEWA|nr:hypothetical protein NDU88_008002 [Pleurodeles waltl]